MCLGSAQQHPCLSISCLHAEQQTTDTLQLAHHLFQAHEVLL